MFGAIALCFSTTVATRAEAQSAEWSPITAERLLAPKPGDWLGYRRTYDVTAFSPLREPAARI